MDQQHRGFRFLFSAAAEVAQDSSPGAGIAARITEISLHGCYLETPAPFTSQTQVLVKIFTEEYFEAKATVIYVNPSGMGVGFREVKPHFRAILQKWVLAAMNQKKPGQA